MADSKSKRARIESLDATEAGSSTPLSTDLAMTAWQQTTETVGERDNYLLDNNMFTDVKCIVGEEGEEILCHRLYLAKTSPTFASMLYGELSKNNEWEIKIPDVSPDAFKALLKYMYSGTLKLKSYDLAWEILYAAKKYLMPDSLLSMVRVYIQKEVLPRYDRTGDDIKRVWPTIQRAQNCAEEELLLETWEYIEKNTSKVLKHDSFVDVSTTILKTLVKKNNLKCTEDELFKACIKWATHKAEIQGKDPEPQNLRKILKPILHRIRFLAFDTKSFSDGPAKSGVLKQSEINSIENYKISNRISSNICAIVTPRKYHKPNHFYVIGEPKHTTCFNCKINGINKPPRFTYSEYASADFENTQTIIGFKIPTQIQASNISRNSTYTEKLTVYLYEFDWLQHRDSDSDNEKDDMQVLHFNSVVKYNSNIVVKFEPDAFKSDEKAYGYGIVFHKSGCYPTKPIVNNAEHDCKFIYNYQDQMESCSKDYHRDADELDCGFMTILVEYD